MRLLANENIPFASVLVLREAGHDILSITETTQGITDREVMHIAHVEKRLILTFDRDYGELVFRQRLAAPAGVLYFRFLPISPRETADYFARLVGGGIKLERHFTTEDRDHVRQRPLAQEEN